MTALFTLLLNLQVNQISVRSKPIFSCPTYSQANPRSRIIGDGSGQAILSPSHADYNLGFIYRGRFRSEMLGFRCMLDLHCWVGGMNSIEGYIYCASLNELIIESNRVSIKSV